MSNIAHKKRIRPALLFTLLFLLLLVLAALSLLFGASSVSLTDAFSGNPISQNNALRILLYLRFPRSLAACLSGGALAAAGAILQCVLNNSLAGPNIIGINAGSGLTMLVFAAIFPSLYSLFPAAAFIGGFASALLIYLIAKLTGASRTTIILSGIAVNSVVNALSGIIKTLRPDVIAAYTDFTVGSISNVSLQRLPVPAGIIIVCIAFSLLLAHDMNVLMLGDEMASSLGMKVGVYRLILIALAAALAGAAVSFAGQISFVGLLVPHIARSFTGNDNRLVIPVSALLGASFVLVCDTTAKVIFSPFDLPVGIVLSVFGGAFFVYLLISRKGGKLHD